METSAVNNRPIGITLLAGVFVVAGVYFMLTGIVFAVAPQLLEEFGYGQNPELWRRLLGLAFSGVVVAILGYTAHGLWTLRQSSRSYAIALACAGPAWLFGKVGDIQNGSIGLVNIALIVVPCALVLAYLLTPPVRQAFQRELPGARR